MTLRKLLIATFALLSFLIITGVWWEVSLSAVDREDKTVRQFVIAPGDGVREVARKLKDGGLIRDQVAFFLLVKRMGIERNIQAGSFQLARAMTALELARKLTLGTEDVWITIPEGWRSEQILEYLKDEIKNNELEMKESDLAIWREDEGRLFPDTYLVPKQMPLSGLRKLLTETFETKTAGDLRRQATASGLVWDEVVILASMVEREGKTDSDRPLVASTLVNRLRLGMKLDVDATVQYAVGFMAKDGWWKKDLTGDDLKIPSAYNTYLNKGLPPGPICNPGLSAIRAVVGASKTDYLYYISDKKGNLHFAKTFEEHQRNIARYLD